MENMMDIKEYILSGKRTLLCVGPMSRNCIDASIELSREYNIPQILIASRRQIDTDSFGGGYVENFTTHSFSEYVMSRGAANIYLARDHGGPWQNPFEMEKRMNIDEAMASAKKSFEADILCNFRLLHIDTSVAPSGEKVRAEKVIEMIFELYGHCSEFAGSNGKDIDFEIGTERQDESIQDVDKFEHLINETIKFCKKNTIKPPMFVVAQTGTKVVEMQNCGLSNNENFNGRHMKQLIKLLEICDKYNVMLKEHNTDYLNMKALALRPELGIHCSNVAPEFGVAETLATLQVLKTYGYEEEYHRFIDIAVESEKWKKWMLKESRASAVDKALISGHYVFAKPEIREIREKVTMDLRSKNIDFRRYLINVIKTAMLKYTKSFNMLPWRNN